MSKTVPYDSYKRLFDIAASSVGLVLTAPVMAVVALLVRQNLGSPVIFKQPRPGKDGQVFTLYKFRSMREVDTEAGLVEDADRLTSFGKFLRSTSLDELPSLLNVLKGEMSMVGPRPLLIEYLDRYNSRQARRHEVRPGITGLAQVKGRNELEWEHKFDLDLEYLEKRSLVLDVKIILMTIVSLVSRYGINHAGHATMHRFGELG